MDLIEFSIITVCFNSSKTITNTFESILNQSYKNFEYIVVDGRSSDRTIEIIKNYENRFREAGIQYVWSSEPDHGIYDAMNKGIKRASGQIIGILNSDDTYTNHALMDIHNAAKENLKIDIYHGLLKYLNNGTIVMIRGSGAEQLEKNMIEHPACFIRRDVYNRYGLFDCKYHYVADYELLLRYKRNGCKFQLVETVISNFDENGVGNSTKSRKELLKLKKNLGIISKLEYTLRRIKMLLTEKRTKKG